MPARSRWTEVKEEVEAVNFEYSFKKFGREGMKGVGTEA